MERDTFSPNELLVLFDKFSPSVILGFKNPISGFLAEEILEFYEQGLASLMLRGIAYADSKNQLMIQAPYDKWIETVCNPQYSVITGWHEKGKQGSSAFHFLDNVIIELTNSIEGHPEGYILNRLDDAESVFEVILRPFYTNFCIDRDELVGEMKRTDLEKVTNYILAQQQDVAKQIIAESGLVEDRITSFMSALSSASTKLTVTSFDMRTLLEEPKNMTFAAIAMDGDLWLIRQGQKKDCVSLLLSSRTTLEDYIRFALPNRGLT